jgi:predicted Rossmann fold flavoprotein
MTSPAPPESADLAVVGAGAAGLFAAIWAGRAARAVGHAPRILALDGARTLGAKILVAGGGRCNVTHHAVDESAYAGSSRNAIKKVLRAFDVPRTVEFFRELGVELKREETGKLFPISDDARTVLNALLRAARDVGVELHHPRRVESVERTPEGFLVRSGGHADVLARRLILATGGMSLPKSGSDGTGYELARALGHTITSRVFPSLVPLVVDPDRSFIRSLSGVTLDTTMTLLSGSGKKLASFTNSTLCTHFGLSGPAVLDISRYYLDAKAEDPGARLVVGWLPGETFERVDADLSKPERVGVGKKLAERLPARLAQALCESAGVDPATPLNQLAREHRRAIAHAVTATPVPVTGDRGFTYAEVTAGGVPLSEIHLATMTSRPCAGLSLCGEICDVDGRIGGFNFQWAWASGYLAGTHALGD